MVLDFLRLTRGLRQLLGDCAYAAWNGHVPALRDYREAFSDSIG